MGANITAYLPAARLARRAVALDLRSESTPQQNLVPPGDRHSEIETKKLDAYEIAVLLFIAGVILTLCL
jgi:hypothetical protein